MPRFPFVCPPCFLQGRCKADSFGAPLTFVSCVKADQLKIPNTILVDIPIKIETISRSSYQVEHTSYQGKPLLPFRLGLITSNNLLELEFEDRNHRDHRDY